MEYKEKKRNGFSISVKFCLPRSFLLEIAFQVGNMWSLAETNGVKRYMAEK